MKRALAVAMLVLGAALAVSAQAAPKKAIRELSRRQRRNPYCDHTKARPQINAGSLTEVSLHPNSLTENHTMSEFRAWFSLPADPKAACKIDRSA